MSNKTINYACIDPGFGGTGVAVYKTDNYTNLPSDTAGFSFSTKQGNLLRRMMLYSNAVMDYVRSHKVKKIFIEGANENFKSEKGEVARRTNAVVKLSYLIGGISFIFLKKNVNHIIDNSNDVIIIQPSIWLGDLDSKALVYQLEKSIGFITNNDHVLHAVGLGEYVKTHYDF